jgi:hypothetical protein
MKLEMKERDVCCCEDVHQVELKRARAKSRSTRRKASQKRAELEELRKQNTEPDMAEMIDEAQRNRPKTRQDCANTQRPCLFVSCKHHLYLDVNQDTGSIKVNFPDKEVWEMRETCALDVADRGGITLEEVGEILNLTRERIRQVEVKGLTKLRHFNRKNSLKDFVQ